MSKDAKEAIGELYALPLGEFVARRDELARRLRSEGERELAAETKSLRKPSVPAWVVNQLARRETRAVEELLAVGERLRRAHEQLLRGGSAEALRRASEAEREALRRLTRAAGPVLADAGLSTSSTTLERVRGTLHAAAVDERVAELVRTGRVTTDEDATGFGLDLLAAAPARDVQARPAAAKARRDKRAREARARVEAAEERLRNAQAALEAAERAVLEHARALNGAERERARAGKEVERAEREVEAARAAGGELEEGPPPRRR